MKSSRSSKTILFLGLKSNPVCQRLGKTFSVKAWHYPLVSNHPYIDECDIAVSFGYRHILKPNVIEKFKRPVVNLHISYLPYNRGADPNLWSFLEKTPSGVSIHQIDKGVDTGPIFAQALVDQDLERGTLATSYEKLFEEIGKLFFQKLPQILSQEIQPIQQAPGGSFHRSSDKQKHLKLLHSGWNTPLRDIWGAACIS